MVEAVDVRRLQIAGALVEKLRDLGVVTYVKVEKTAIEAEVALPPASPDTCTKTVVLTISCDFRPYVQGYFVIADIERVKKMLEIAEEIMSRLCTGGGR